MTSTLESIVSAAGGPDDDPLPVYACAQIQRLRQSVRENSPVYVYARVYDAVKELLLSGTVESGQRLPTCNELADFLLIAHTTVRRAMRRLSDEGLVWCSTSRAEPSSAQKTCTSSETRSTSKC